MDVLHAAKGRRKKINKFFDRLRYIQLGDINVVLWHGWPEQLSRSSPRRDALGRRRPLDWTGSRRDCREVTGDERPIRVPATDCDCIINCAYTYDHFIERNAAVVCYRDSIRLTVFPKKPPASVSICSSADFAFLLYKQASFYLGVDCKQSKQYESVVWIKKQG